VSVGRVVADEFVTCCCLEALPAVTDLPQAHAGRLSCRNMREERKEKGGRVRGGGKKVPRLCVVAGPVAAVAGSGARFYVKRSSFCLARSDAPRLSRN